MGALHFLDFNFLLADYSQQGISHNLELFETGGELFLRLWVGGRGAGQPVLCRLTQAQADDLAESAQQFARRLKA